MERRMRSTRKVRIAIAPPSTDDTAFHEVKAEDVKRGLKDVKKRKKRQRPLGKGKGGDPSMLFFVSRTTSS